MANHHVHLLCLLTTSTMVMTTTIMYYSFTEQGYYQPFMRYSSDLLFGMWYPLVQVFLGKKATYFRNQKLRGDGDKQKDEDSGCDNTDAKVKSTMGTSSYSRQVRGREHSALLEIQAAFLGTKMPTARLLIVI